MRNFAVKFAILSNRLLERSRQPVAANMPDAFDADAADYLPEEDGAIETVYVRDLIDLEPEALLENFRKRLSPKDATSLFFGFTDKAFLDVLDYEFDVDMERNLLIFKKGVLNSASISLAAGHGANAQPVLDENAEMLIEHLSSWLYEATRSLYREELGEDRVADIRLEYKICLRDYANKYALVNPDKAPSDILHTLFSSAKAMKAFTHSMTVDAMFKADAAKVVFGEQSGYYQAWFRKEIFRNMMARCTEQYIIKTATQSADPIQAGEPLPQPSEDTSAA